MNRAHQLAQRAKIEPRSPLRRLTNIEPSESKEILVYRTVLITIVTLGAIAFHAETSLAFSRGGSSAGPGMVHVAPYSKKGQAACFRGCMGRRFTWNQLWFCEIACQ